MDFRELETFVTIVEKGSVSGAAAALGVSQPAVSKRIARLEEEMGSPLFANGHKHSSLTSEGGVLYKAALKMLETRRQARIQIAEISQDLYGTVRVAASSIPGDFILPKLLVEFSQNHPGVSVRIIQGDSRTALEDLSSKKADLAVIGSDRTLPGFTSVPFFHDEMVLIVNRAHPLASKQFVTLEEAASLKLVGRTSGSGTRQNWERACKSRTGSFREPEVQFGHTMGVVNAVVAGAEGGIVSIWAAETSPAVVALRFRPALYRTFQLVHGICETKAVEVLLSFLTQKAEERT
ncbi:MAG: LysR family transcriptional regulator, partial [Pyramidobacter sp.]|nr:LysR family transcriptional regulator [Pyramidobacter sp.]